MPFLIQRNIPKPQSNTLNAAIIITNMFVAPLYSITDKRTITPEIINPKPRFSVFQKIVFHFLIFLFLAIKHLV